MRQNFVRKEFKALLAILMAISAVPCGVWFLESHPFSGQSVEELQQTALSERQEQIMDVMRARYEAQSLKMEDPDPAEDPDIRWQQIQLSVSDTSQDSVAAVRIA